MRPHLVVEANILFYASAEMLFRGIVLPVGFFSLECREKGLGHSVVQRSGRSGKGLIENGAGYDITPAGNAFLLEFNKKLLEHDVTSIYLDKDEYKLLKTMLKRPDKEVAGKQLEPLVLAGVADFKYVEKDGSPGGCVAVCNITKTGRRYIQYRSQNAIRTWAPIIISGLALIISIVSLGLSLSQ